MATLRVQAVRINKLIDDEYGFVSTARFQSDPTESCFSQYQQMSSGRFHVSLREVFNAERRK